MPARYCLVNLHEVRRLKEPGVQAGLVLRLGGKREKGSPSLAEHLLCAKPHANCSAFTILFNLCRIQ